MDIQRRIAELTYSVNTFPMDGPIVAEVLIGMLQVLGEIQAEIENKQQEAQE